MYCRFILITGIVCSVGLAATANAQDETTAGDGLAYTIDFTDFEAGAVNAWLEGKGFQLEKDADNRKKVALEAGGDGLAIKVKRPAFGLLVNERAEVQQYSKVHLVWGVRDFPDSASYERGINNEAVMVYVFFGRELQSSGSLFIPNSPYFIALYLCDNDTLDKPYKGRYYEQSARFVCVGKPAEGEVVETEFDLTAAFRRYFNKQEVPPVSGVSLGFDTNASGDDGRAAAFVRRIQFTE